MLPTLVGHPESWRPIYDKFRPFFDLAQKMNGVINEMITHKLTDQLAQVIGYMVFTAANACGAVHVLVLNGYGADAFKLSRGIFETDVNVAWLKKHPEDLAHYVQYHAIQRKRWYDQMDEEEKRQVGSELHDEIMAEYRAALPLFDTGRGKPRAEWCRENIRVRAQEAGQLDLYLTYFNEVSSVHHGDIAGILAQCDSDGRVIMAPSDNFLYEALLSGQGSMIRCLEYFNEVAQLGLADRIQELIAGYEAAVKSVSQQTLS